MSSAGSTGFEPMICVTCRELRACCRVCSPDTGALLNEDMMAGDSRDFDGRCRRVKSTGQRDFFISGFVTIFGVSTRAHSSLGGYYCASRGIESGSF